jgi:hypothetical protein
MASAARTGVTTLATLQTGMKEGMDPSFARLDELLRALA